MQPQQSLKWASPALKELNQNLCLAAAAYRETDVVFHGMSLFPFVSSIVNFVVGLGRHGHQVSWGRAV